ncbi:MAG TPA: hypothetical protein PLO51_02490 [Candidatus Micrarchaeota archaeon]|nr:hypothetical protein [Candidatus Micrarchaeota archaeon]
MKISKDGRLMSTRAFANGKEKIFTVELGDDFTLIALSNPDGSEIETWEIKKGKVIHNKPVRKVNMPAKNEGMPAKKIMPVKKIGRIVKKK